MRIELTALILEVFKLNGALIAAGHRLLADLRLTSARCQVLGAVRLAPTPHTVPDIARTMGLTRQSVQRIVNDLVESALLERSENPRHLPAAAAAVAYSRTMPSGKRWTRSRPRSRGLSSAIGQGGTQASTTASPHLFEKITVSGICVAC